MPAGKTLFAFGPKTRLNRRPDQAGGSVQKAICCSDDPDVLSLLALTARGDVELYVVTLVKGLVTRAIDVREVDEYIFAIFTGNEAVALLGVEELYGACCQGISLSAYFELVRATCSANSVRHSASQRDDFWF